MVKKCQICGKLIWGKARKYCKDCKSKTHKKQMHDYYEANKCKWLCINGKYNKTNRGQICDDDPLPFGDHRYGSHKLELQAIEEEMLRLGLTPSSTPQFKKDKPDYVKARWKKYYVNNKGNTKYKLLFRMKFEKYCYLNILLLHNSKTDHIGIRTSQNYNFNGDK